MLWLCGRSSGPEDLIDLMFEGDTVSVTYDGGLSRPLKLTATEAMTLAVALRTLTDVPGATAGRGGRAGAGQDRDGGRPAPGHRPRVDIRLAAQDRWRSLAQRAVEPSAGRSSCDYYTAARDESTAPGDRPGPGVQSPTAIAYLEAWCRRAEGDADLPAGPVRGRRRCSTSRPGCPDDVASLSRRLAAGVYRPAPEHLLVELRLGPGWEWVSDYYPCESVTPATAAGCGSACGWPTRPGWRRWSGGPAARSRCWRRTGWPGTCAASAVQPRWPPTAISKLGGHAGLDGRRAHGCFAVAVRRRACSASPATRSAGRPAGWPPTGPGCEQLMAELAAVGGPAAGRRRTGCDDDPVSSGRCAATPAGQPRGPDVGPGPPARAAPAADHRDGHHRARRGGRLAGLQPAAGDPQAAVLQHALPAPAGRAEPERRAVQAAVPGAAGRLHHPAEGLGGGRRHPHRAALALPAVGVRHAGPAPQREALDGRLRRRLHPAVRRSAWGWPTSPCTRAWTC